MKVAQKLKVLIFLLLVSLCLFFLVFLPFPCRCYGRAVCWISFIISAPVVHSVSFFIRRRKWVYALCSCRFFGTMENAYSLTRAIQLRKWVIAGTPSFPPWMWKESVTVKTVAIQKYIATRPLRNLSLESFKVSSLCYSTTIRKHRGINKWQFYAQTNL